jgi:hypothetical protein
MFNLDNYTIGQIQVLGNTLIIVTFLLFCMLVLDNRRDDK